MVAIDGKTLIKSFDKAHQQSAIHMVSAFASASKLVLGQQKVDDKSNEITFNEGKNRNITSHKEQNKIESLMGSHTELSNIESKNPAINQNADHKKK